jgi:GNAT superfamily N-acetyltransferase
MIQIHKAGINEIEPFAQLFDSYRVFYEKKSDLEGARNFLKERIENHESVVFLAADKENRFKGFVQLYPIFSSTRMKRLWLLNDLFVVPESRGLGIGKSLIESSKNHCLETEACGLLLETAKTNIEGNHLYPKEGFVLDKDHNYYTWEP